MNKKQTVWMKVIIFTLLIALVPFSTVVAQDATADDMMATAEANKEIVHGFLENVFSTGDTSLIGDYIAPVIIEHEGSPEPMEMPVEELNMGLAGLHEAIPDFEVEIIEMVAEGDKVAVIATWTGTHTGEFMGAPATGNEISINVFDLFRIEDGLIVEHWGVTDNLAFMTQLGMMPMPEDG